MSDVYQTPNDFVAPPRIGPTLANGGVQVGNVAATASTPIDVSALGGRMLWVQAVGGDLYVGFGATSAAAANVTTANGWTIPSGSLMPFMLQATVDNYFAWIGSGSVSNGVRYYVSTPSQIQVTP